MNSSLLISTRYAGFQELLARGSIGCLTWDFTLPGDTTLDLKEIKAIIDLMKKNDLAVFKLEKEGFKLELEVNRPSPPAVALAYPQIAAPPVYPAAPGVASARPSASGQAAGQTTESYKEI